MVELKRSIVDQIDRMSDRLVELSTEIHNHPEEGFEEVRASTLISSELSSAGFRVELGVAGLPTALSAVHPCETTGVTVALVGEYDALPGIGHGCGHNLIAVSALGAALAVGAVKAQLPGRLLLLGTPSEEYGGGKVLMERAGLFETADVAMMAHPSPLYTSVDERSLALARLELAFKGKPAHAAVSPEHGINALDAVIQTFNGLNALRQHLREDTRVHGIITNGGAKPNIVPEDASALFYVRSPDNNYRDEVVRRLHACADGAALATGAKLSFRVIDPSYDALRPNPPLAGVFESNWHALGHPISPQPRSVKVGSTDMGNISQTIPAIHVHFRICDEAIPVHSREFERAAVSDRAHMMMIVAAKALAMTTVDLLTRPQLITDIRQAFLQGGTTHPEV